MELEVFDNKEKKRFEAPVKGKLAFIEYIRAKGGVVYLTHTEVPRELEGQGIGSGLVVQVLRILKEDNNLLAPLCPFVAAYIKRHPEWRELLAPNYNV